MKKLLLLFVCACALASCSQDNDVLMNEPQKQTIFEESDSTGVELRAANNQLLGPANQIPLYEYVCMSGGQYVDFYYTSKHLGYSFYDSRSGNTYTYERKLGSIGKNMLPYPDNADTFPVTQLCLYYNWRTGKHEIIGNNHINLDQEHYGYTRVGQLGFIPYQMHPDDRFRQANRTWLYLSFYKIQNTNIHRLDDYDLQDHYRANGWFHMGSYGWYVNN